MYLELLNKQKVKLNTKLKLRTLEIAEDMGLISKGFLGRILSIATSTKDSSNVNVTDVITNIDDNDLTNSPYLAYLNANGEDSMSYEDFSELLPLNIRLFAEVYMDILAKSGSEESYILSESFKKATPHQKIKVKKKIPQVKINNMTDALSLYIYFYELDYSFIKNMEVSKIKRLIINKIHIENWKHSE